MTGIYFLFIGLLLILSCTIQVAQLSVKEPINQDNQHNYFDLSGINGCSNGSSNTHKSMNAINSSSALKRSRVDDNDEDEAKLGEPNKTKKRLEYRNNTNPISTEIDPEMRELLKSREIQIQQAGREFKWDYSNLTRDRAKYLCLESFQQMNIDVEIPVIEDMIADCDSKNVPGPSAIPKNGKYLIYYQHWKEDNTYVGFFADLIRCNCAYTQFSLKGLLRTVNNSKRYFYIFKWSEIVYYILTPIQKTSPFSLVIVNVFEIPADLVE